MRTHSLGQGFFSYAALSLEQSFFQSQIIKHTQIFQIIFEISHFRAILLTLSLSPPPLSVRVCVCVWGGGGGCVRACVCLCAMGYMLQSGEIAHKEYIIITWCSKKRGGTKMYLLRIPFRSGRLSDLLADWLIEYWVTATYAKWHVYTNLQLRTGMLFCCTNRIILSLSLSRCLSFPTFETAQNNKQTNKKHNNNNK